MCIVCDNALESFYYILVPDGLIGLGILGGASLFVGGAAVLLGMALASKK